MSLEAWRHSFEPKLTLSAAADRLGISGSNPARRYQRYETGETAIDLILALRIFDVTNGTVSIRDLADVRERWLREKNAAPATSCPVPFSAGAEREAAR